MRTAKQIITEMHDVFGMSDEKIAARINGVGGRVTQPTVCRLRNGTLKSCSFELYFAITRARSGLRRPKKAA